MAVNLRPRMKFGKYRLKRMLGRGAYSTVWRAYDPYEAIDVALKIPHANLSAVSMREFQSEAKTVAALDHPNILKIKNADHIDGRFVLTYDIGKRSLFQELRQVIKPGRAFFLMREMLQALAYAHDHGVIHRDLKPENVILFGKDKLRLADFGISKLATKTIMTDNPLGTIGYMAPEQAYGKASFSADTFAAGIIFYEMLTRHQVSWPFRWPFKHHERVRKLAGQEIYDFIVKASNFDAAKRFTNAQEMLREFLAIEQKLAMQRNRQRKFNLRKLTAKPVRRKTLLNNTANFVQRFGKLLELNYTCKRCRQKIAEHMIACPWCGYDKNDFSRRTRFPYYCTDCKKGVYGDYAYCPWCYSEKFKLIEGPPSKDKRYSGVCANSRCGGKLMPFMSYCPWCQRKRRKPWKVARLADSCPKCHWSVDRSHWKYCPWCKAWLL